MRGYLLDTHTAIFSMHQSKSLSATAKDAVAKGPNYLSVISYWEVMIKSMKGTLDVGNPRAWWSTALEQLAAAPLLLRPQQIDQLHTLPPIHKDPFDRILVAQATVEGLTLVTSDKTLARYAGNGLRVVG